MLGRRAPLQRAVRVHELTRGPLQAEATRCHLSLHVIAQAFHQLPVLAEFHVLLEGELAPDVPSWWDLVSDVVHWQVVQRDVMLGVRHVPEDEDRMPRSIRGEVFW